MTYFADLTPYTYLLPERPEPGTLNVGWLADGPISPGALLSEALLTRLASHVDVRVNATRGYHPCAACGNRPLEEAVKLGVAPLGSAEIRVFGPQGETFAAPNLIHHYVQAHAYRPPDAFLRALAEGPAPGTAAYLARLTRLGHTWQPPHTPLRQPQDVARERARGALADATGDTVLLLDEPGMEKHYGWVFRYASTVGGDTRIAAIVVEHEQGRVSFLGTARPIDEEVAAFDARRPPRR